MAAGAAKRIRPFYPALRGQKGRDRSSEVEHFTAGEARKSQFL